MFLAIFDENIKNGLNVTDSLNKYLQNQNTFYAVYIQIWLHSALSRNQKNIKKTWKILSQHQSRHLREP